MRLALRVLALLMVLAVVGFFSVGIAVRRMFPHADRARIEALKSSGRPIVEAIEAWHRVRGKFPDALGSIGEPASSASGAGWNYRKHDDGKGYVLCIGDYGVDHFVLLWDSDYPEWTTDE